MAEISNEDLLAQLGVEVKKEKKSKLTPREERIMAGFEEVQRFVEDHGRAPLYGEEYDIFERLYATRLDQIRLSEECRGLLKDIDYQGLLSEVLSVSEPAADYTTDEALLAELGVKTPKEGDITHLKHVKSSAEKKAAEEIASRAPCQDFDKFKSIFEQVQTDLKTGIRTAELLTRQPSIEVGDWFILLGQKAYVTESGEEFVNESGAKDKRLRVIFDNATESNLLMRSLQKALKQDEAGRRIMDVSAGPLFDSVADDEDLASGTIYVLRSKSELNVITQNRSVIHKIGVTGGKVEKRIANAKDDPTYLLADVEIVATYELFNINRVKLEKLLHRFFENSKLDVEVIDRFGKPVVPREWFLVPLHVINEVVEKIKDGTIGSYKYNVNSASLDNV